MSSREHILNAFDVNALIPGKKAESYFSAELQALLGQLSAMQQRMVALLAIAELNGISQSRIHLLRQEMLMAALGRSVKIKPSGRVPISAS